MNDTQNSLRLRLQKEYELMIDKKYTGSSLANELEDKLKSIYSYTKEELNFIYDDACDAILVKLFAPNTTFEYSGL
tara:strand:+ start:4102 stop:4329 length:228 start_codon:yes stop_codon:yes gene_type:complete